MSGAGATPYPDRAAWPAHPVIYEISTWVWLDELSRALGAPVTLSDVPAGEWDRIAEMAVDAVWLMGVWERSPAGTEIARADAGLRRQAAALLGDEHADGAIVGSPYCVRRYVADPHLGGFAGLDAAWDQLRTRGIRLLLDFVPNHVAPDHPWVREHPEYLIAEGAEFAFGRESQEAAPWRDVVQVNAFHPGLRAASIETLSAIAAHCDGVRCDMAMLALSDVFARTWGDRAGPVPDQEYWTELIGGVRAENEEFLFVAEAYWDREWRLMQLGFDFCYDKVLCDRLIHGDGPAIAAHLGADLAFQRRLVRFVENHDEDRSAAVMTPERARAAAVALATLPGATLLYEGQFVGRRARVPVALGRRPTEAADTVLEDFYRRLLGAGARLRSGDWELCPVTGWPDNDSFRHILAWSWRTVDAVFLVAVNFSAEPAQGRVNGPPAARFTDLLSGAVYDRDPDELRRNGLYVALAGHGFHLLEAHEPL